MMNRELQLFLTALSFYSRMPVPDSVHQNSELLLPDAIRYFPLVGWVAGFVAGGIYLMASFLLGPELAVILSMVATILLTGAFHEDGFADSCDGFGGGWTKERILLIMKDSCLGTYGVTGLILLLTTKYLASAQLLTGTADVMLIIGMLVVAHSLSRFAAVAHVFNQTYVRIVESKASGAVEKGKRLNFIIALIFAIIPLATLVIYTSSFAFLLILIPISLLNYRLSHYFEKWIGGYTGDCLGTVQQLTEITIYLALIMVWKFI